jgi:hypothetical protein
MEQTLPVDASSEYGGAGVGGGGGLSFHCIIHLSSDSTSRRTPELTQPARAAFNIIGEINDESHAIAGLG